MQPHPKRYGFEIAQRPPLPETEADLEAVRRDGFVILERLIDDDRCNAIRAETARLLKGGGRNSFEGFNTQRVYNVLAKTRLLDDLIDHPRVLALLDALFEANYLLSQAQLINIRAGEAAQALHYDDGFYKVPRPRPALGAATIQRFCADRVRADLIGCAVDANPSRRWRITCSRATSSSPRAWKPPMTGSTTHRRSSQVNTSSAPA